MTFAGSQLCVRIRRDEATYHLFRGEPLRTAHHGEPLTLTAGQQVTLPIPPAPRHPVPGQPPGRAPARRRPVPPM